MLAVVMKARSLSLDVVLEHDAAPLLVACATSLLHLVHLFQVCVSI